MTDLTQRQLHAAILRSLPGRAVKVEWPHACISASVFGGIEDQQVNLRPDMRVEHAVLELAGRDAAPSGRKWRNVQSSPAADPFVALEQIWSPACLSGHWASSARCCRDHTPAARPLPSLPRLVGEGFGLSRQLTYADATGFDDASRGPPRSSSHRDRCSPPVPHAGLQPRQLPAHAGAVTVAARSW